MTIPDGELDRIRSDALSLLSATGRVWHRTTEVTDGGGTTDSWTPGANLPCRIAPIGGGEDGTRPGDRISDRTTHVVTLPAYTTIAETAQVEVGGAGLYEVTAVRERTFDELVRRVEVVESTEDIPQSGSGSGS